MMLSHSVWSAWIEIISVLIDSLDRSWSHSVWSAWIEIVCDVMYSGTDDVVALRMECVD